VSGWVGGGRGQTMEGVGSRVPYAGATLGGGVDAMRLWSRRLGFEITVQTEATPGRWHRLEPGVAVDAALVRGSAGSVVVLAGAATELGRLPLSPRWRDAALMPVVGLRAKGNPSEGWTVLAHVRGAPTSMGIHADSLPSRWARGELLVARGPLGAGVTARVDAARGGDPARSFSGYTVCSLLSVGLM